MTVPEAGDESRLVVTAERLIAPLVKADRARKRQMRVLSLGCLVLLVVAVFTGIGYFSNRDAAAQLRSQNQVLNSIVQRQQSAEIASCEAGNTARATNQFIWVSFITLALKGNNSATAQQEGKAFIALVEKNEKAQDCTRLYG